MAIQNVSLLNNIPSNIINSSNNTKPVNNDSSFSDLLMNKLNDLSNEENITDNMKTEYVNGQRDDIQNILIESQKFNLQLNYALQIRNNLVNMFQEISKMQI